MKIATNSMVRLEYQVKDQEGNILDKSEPGNDISYIHGTGSIIRGLESALEGHENGEKFSAIVKAADAYGEWESALVGAVPRKELPPDMEFKQGMVLQVSDEFGMPKLITVHEVREAEVVMDWNHPLAGKDLTFDVSINEVREATAEEIEQLHAAHSSCGCDCGCEDEGGECGPDCGPEGGKCCG